jgi:beta-mannosidase
MKTARDLSELEWTVSGWIPYQPLLMTRPEINTDPAAETPAVPARVPGSVQQSLLDAGVLPDWNQGVNYKQCEWVENRHWSYETHIPDDWLQRGKQVRLNCQGLDYAGWVVLNGKTVGEFRGTHTPYAFDLTDHLAESGNILRILFDVSPRWLGQFGYTSRMRDWKVRFNYSWDWTARLVQIGIWDTISLEIFDGREIEQFRCYTQTDAQSKTGRLVCLGKIAEDPSGAKTVVQVALTRGGKAVAEKRVCAAEFNAIGLDIEEIPVELWWPNMEGDQPLYDVQVQLMDESGNGLDSLSRRVGFREVKWLQCEGAPEGADPWICSVNGKSLFLQGANWVPPRTAFADVKEADYRKRVQLYKDLGANILRVWGGATLEREKFYDLCDEMGIMVWQEFPLSSSGGDCIPPQDEEFAEQAASIARSYIPRRQHHASLIMWCGGNELINPDPYVPLDEKHVTIKRMGDVVREMDPTRRYLPTSPQGPKVGASMEDYGKGLHWDVHGPWKAEGDLETDWRPYWEQDDSLFHAETGAPGASSVEIIRGTSGGLDCMPPTVANPVWRRNGTWWIETPQFVTQMGREPATLEEYVDWSQARQKKALMISVGSCKKRFPKCGGVILWMGHDCYPCAANTSIIDFNGDPKPAALALKEIWRRKAG